MVQQAKNRVMLSEMSEVLNEQFGRYLDEPISDRTPYDWWKRTKEDNITEPLPKPIMIVGRSPVFRKGDLIAWFVRYKGISKLSSKVSVKEENEGEG